MSEWIECTKGNGSHSYRATEGRCGWCANLEAQARKELRLEELEAALEIVQFELSPGPDAARSLAARVRVARRTLDRVLGSSNDGEAKS